MSLINKINSFNYAAREDGTCLRLRLLSASKAIIEITTNDIYIDKKSPVIPTKDFYYAIEKIFGKVRYAPDKLSFRI